MTTPGRGGLTALAMLVALVVAPAVRAEGAYTSEDTLAAIDEAAVDTGVSRAWLYAVVACETGGTFDPYAVGRLGELGAAQLAPWGELRRFRAWGYDDPYSPYQSVRFMAQRFAMGGARAWSCA